MCGIFGVIAESKIERGDLDVLVSHARQRGKDSSGLLIYCDDQYQAHRADYGISQLVKEVNPYHASIILGHSRLVTNGMVDNQPVIREGVCAFHNGIIVNHESIWGQLSVERMQEIDTEVIVGISLVHLNSGATVESLAQRILSLCEGVVACSLVLQEIGKLLLFSNNGSLYIGDKAGGTYFSSEEYPLVVAGCERIRQVKDAVLVDIPMASAPLVVEERPIRHRNLIPSLVTAAEEEGLLEYHKHALRRCTKCILPETMPYISFNDEGVCNYCQNYTLRNVPLPVEKLHALVEPYRRSNGNECIVPFSGGRDSCYGLHLIVNELKMKPVTYTYDWGMVTDLGRRNISRMCSKLGVENIIVAADISKKRHNIALNLKAWLKSPHLGMISILTAGDKHFFRHIESIKRQTNISLNLWGVNPLEVTHFKAGFLGVPPYFEEERVYTHGVMKQLRYQALRFNAMLKSPGYFNRSLWDTLYGEYYRSFHKKTDYYHIFDYWRWEEKLIDEVLLYEYDWERAPDTRTTWRIGDGTAAFYNYIYYTVAGFTEHDTFRSNQIREGEITREKALELVEDENQPRYPNIKWYLDAITLEFSEVIPVVNAIPKMYKSCS